MLVRHKLSYPGIRKKKGGGFDTERAACETLIRLDYGLKKRTSAFLLCSSMSFDLLLRLRSLPRCLVPMAYL